MKKILIALTALSVAASAASASEWLPMVFMDRYECNREAVKMKKSTRDNDVFWVCAQDAEGNWRLVTSTKFWQGGN